MKKQDVRKDKDKDFAVIIYDGKCPVCTGTVEWIRANEISGSFEMVPCQSEERSMLHPVVNRAECMKAMHLVLPDGAVLVGEQALPYILARIKGYRFAAPILKLPGAAGVSRIAYRWFADRRYRIATILSHLAGNRKRAT
jgi:predicted DCC family thiol-disulfide oxidoreductase YuxK